MKQFIDKLISRLEEQKKVHLNDEEFCLKIGKTEASVFCSAKARAVDGAIEIVNQLAEEYKGGWIPCEVRLPNKEESTDVYVTYMDSRTKERFVDIECYFHGVWVKSLEWYKSRVAWMPLPSPYQKEGE